MGSALGCGLTLSQQRPEDAPDLNQVNTTNTDAEQSRRSRFGTWKFWRRFSLRRNKPPRSRKKRGWGSVPNESGRGGNLMPLNGLPDVLEEASLRRCQSTRPPEKPPRMFLLRGSTISSPSASSVAEVPTDDADNMAHMTNGNLSSDSTNSFSRHCLRHYDAKHGTKCTTAEPMIVSQYTSIVPDNINGWTLPDKYSPWCTDNERIDSGYNLPKHVTLTPTKSPTQLKLVTPDYKTKSLPRSRSRSGDKRHLTSPHCIILQSAHELLCQKLDPTDVLHPLYMEGVITAADLQAFDGHPDRRLICESLVNSLMRGEYHHFLSFCDALRRCGCHGGLSMVLDAMVGISELLYNVPEENMDDSEQVFNEEKTYSFELAILDKYTSILRPIIELERGHNRETLRRSMREPGNHRIIPRLSSLSFTEGSIANKEIHTSGLPVITVCISGYSLHGERARALADVIDKYHCIYELRIGKTQLTGQDLDYICAALENNHTMTVLDVRLNDIGDDGATKLGTLLRKSSNLRQLNVSSSGIGTLGCMHLCDGLMINACIRDLDLSFLDLGDHCCLYIAEMLTKNCSITKLRLRNNNITWVGCGCLFEALEQNERLRELDLSRNFVGDKGIEIISKNLYKANNLYELNLENCGMTSAGCEHWVNTLPFQTSLKSLDLSVNFIGDLGVKHLCQVLRTTKTLETLGINMCGITNTGLVNILDAMEDNHSLIMLKLCYNRFGREGTQTGTDLDDIRFKLHCTTSSKPRLKVLLWGNNIDDSS